MRRWPARRGSNLHPSTISGFCLTRRTRRPLKRRACGRRWPARRARRRRGCRTGWSRCRRTWMCRSSGVDDCSNCMLGCLHGTLSLKPGPQGALGPHCIFLLSFEQCSPPCLAGCIDMVQGPRLNANCGRLQSLQGAAGGSAAAHAWRQRQRSARSSGHPGVPAARAAAGQHIRGTPNRGHRPKIVASNGCIIP